MQALIQNTIQFLKRHYEKIILCVVLLGLAGAAVWMGSKISAVQDEVSQAVPESRPNARPLQPMDLSKDLAVLATVTNPPPVILSGDHNLFNPVTWRRKANGDLLKILRTGPDALRVVNITPLYTVIAYDHPSGSGEVYVLDIQVHSAKKPAEYAKKDETKKTRLYIIRGIKGAPDNPDELDLEVPGEPNLVPITKNNPFKRVDGHIADLRYDPESRNFNKQRVNDTIPLDNEQYNIVEITNNLVTVESKNNGKKTTINWNGSP